MELQWPAPAKLNLFLYITGRRADGYHDLQTLFQFLDYGDTLTITATDSPDIRLTTPIAGVAFEENLIIKAARLLQKKTGTNAGARIGVTKRLPMGGGLGGGSSNAATVLVALNKLWHCHLSPEELAQLGRQLGADIPIFIYGHAAFAEGIGDILTPISPVEKWYLIAHPKMEIATAAIFNDPELIRNNKKRPLDTLLHLPFSNDCEAVVRKRFPEIDALISWLLNYAPTRLTGTGACVFAEFDTEFAAQEVLAHAPTWLIGFVAKGANRSPLQHHLCTLR